MVTNAKCSRPLDPWAGPACVGLAGSATSLYNVDRTLDGRPQAGRVPYRYEVTIGIGNFSDTAFPNRGVRLELGAKFIEYSQVPDRMNVGRDVEH